MQSTIDKNGLRAASLALRAAVDPAVSASFAQRLARLGPELAAGHAAGSVSVFWSIKDELPTHLLCAAFTKPVSWSVCR